MYLQQVAGVNEAQAEWQLSPLFGHLNLPFIGAYAMDDTLGSFRKGTSVWKAEYRRNLTVATAVGSFCSL